MEVLVLELLYEVVDLVIEFLCSVIVTVVILGRAALLGENGLGCLTDLDRFLVVIGRDLTCVDRLYV